MDGLVEELLRLESAKHKALVEIDASAYDASVRAQLLPNVPVCGFPVLNAF